MSTMSSSHSNLGGQHGGKNQNNENDSMFGEEGENPFKQPSDELIFSFKETEKDRKIIEREKNKQLKIWEKNRPIREGCLRKICETDIEPTQLAINPKVQSKVNVAEAAGFNIPIERPKNRENRWNLIQKKREMGLVRDMLETKQKEIERLAEYATMREDGLTCSESMLEEDTKQFLEFFKDIKTKAQEAQQELEKARRIKNEKTNDLRKLNEDIQVLQSTVSKNIESLELYNGYKTFLDELYLSTCSKEDRLKEEMKMKRKKDKFEEKRRMKEKESQMREDQIYQTKLNASKGKQDFKGKKLESKEEEKDSIQSLEQELNIGLEIQNIYEDDDDDLEIGLENEEALMKIFTNLEEKNLLAIVRMQASEQQLEQKRYQKIQQEKELNALYDILLSNEKSNLQRIEKTNNELNSLQGFSDDQDSQYIDENSRKQIDLTTMKLYLMTIGKVNLDSKQSDQDVKRVNQNTLQMLNEIEFFLNEHFEYFDNIIQFGSPQDQHRFKEIMKKIKGDERQKNRDENKKKELAAIKAKKEERKNDMEKRSFQKVGKPAMKKIYAPPLPKIETKAKELTQEEQDLKDYDLGELIQNSKEDEFK